MWTMILYELKKLYRTPISIALLVVLVLIPLGYGFFHIKVGNNTSMDGVAYENIIVKDGVTYEGGAAYHQQQELYKTLQGVMDEDWFQDKREQLQTLLDTNSKDHLSLQLMLMDIMQMKPFTQGAMWRSDADYMALFGHEASEEEQTMDPFLVSEMNKVDSFYYGSYTNWKFLSDCISCFALFFVLYISVQGAMVYNSEHTHHMMEEIKTGRIGKAKAGNAKLLSIFTIALLVPIVSILLYTLITWMIFGLQNGTVTLASYHTITPFTFQEMVVQGSFLVVLGCMAMAALSMALSTIVPSTYVSVSTIVTLLLLPFFFMVQSEGILLSLLFPIFYLMISNVFANFPFLTILSHTMYYRDYVLLQTSLCMLLGTGYTIWNYRRYE